MRYETPITGDQYTQARKKTDEFWSDYEVFDEERADAPLRELVAETVEGEFTHPDGHHSIETLTDSVAGLVADYVDMLPEEVPTPVCERFRLKLHSEVSDHAETVYRQCRDEAEGASSIQELQSIIDAQLDASGVPEGY